MSASVERVLSARQRYEGVISRPRIDPLGGVAAVDADKFWDEMGNKVSFSGSRVEPELESEFSAALAERSAFANTERIAHDPVHHPAHYTTGAVECIDAIHAALGDEGFIAYCRGNAIKYAWRAPQKNDEGEDYEKARWYLARAAEVSHGANREP